PIYMRRKSTQCGDGAPQPRGQVNAPGVGRVIRRHQHGGAVVGVQLIGASVAVGVFTIVQVHRGFELQPVGGVVCQVLIDVVFLQAIGERPLHTIGVVAVAGTHGNTALVVLGSAGCGLFR